ncbi:MAG: cobyrinate a,c-diamide synthase [Pseudomonadota bacterium]
MSKGFVISAPTSNAGKTLITLGMLRALKNKGIVVHSAKSGPDYIDPQFHAVASGKPCINLDCWAMSEHDICAYATPPNLLVVEGAMGLYDSAPTLKTPFGKGSTADLATTLGFPVILVLDISKLSQTAAAIVSGLDQFKPGISIAGIILNKVSSARHQEHVTRALLSLGYSVLGAIPRCKDLNIPSRHLGLVQAHENEGLENFLQRAANLIETHISIDKVYDLAKQAISSQENANIFPPLGQRMAIAKDSAFTFVYPHMLQGWHKAGAELSFFSPLADEGPEAADAIFLPGGYPELYAETLANRQDYIKSMHKAAKNNSIIYGECGGFMCLGQSLTLQNNKRYPMLGLLPIETSLANPKLHLGYRKLYPEKNDIWQKPLMAHEFHYTQLIHQDKNTPPLFQAENSMEENLGPIGAQKGNVMGSFAHIICEQA